MIEKLLRSNAEARILGIVLFEDALHLREIARMAKIFPSEAKRELDILCSIGLLSREKRGNQAIFLLNPSCPFAPELRSLYLKTEGVFVQLKEALKNLDGIAYAFVFGSAAAGKERKGSDIDLLAIGSVSEEALSEKIWKIQRKSGREINFILWSEKDFLKKLKANGAFVNSVAKNPKIWLVGDENEFGRIAEKALGGKNRKGR